MFLEPSIKSFLASKGGKVIFELVLEKSCHNAQSQILMPIFETVALSRGMPMLSGHSGGWHLKLMGHNYLIYFSTSSRNPPQSSGAT